MLTAEEARRIWRYDPDTGYFFWLVPRSSIQVGDRAGHFDGDKYWRLFYDGKKYMASHVAWLMVTGEWPKDQIDHRNRNKLDDRFGNLREASARQNGQNRLRSTKNKLGVKGVHPSNGDRVRAIINVDGKNINLGFYATVDEAKAVYDAAVIRHHGEFACLGESDAPVS